MASTSFCAVARQLPSATGIALGAHRSRGPPCALYCTDVIARADRCASGRAVPNLGLQVGGMADGTKYTDFDINLTLIAMTSTSLLASLSPGPPLYTALQTPWGLAY